MVCDAKKSAIRISAWIKNCLSFYIVSIQGKLPENHLKAWIPMRLSFTTISLLLDASVCISPLKL